MRLLLYSRARGLGVGSLPLAIVFLEAQVGKCLGVRRSARSFPRSHSAFFPSFFHIISLAPAFTSA